jgi:glucose dehydrogenase
MRASLGDNAGAARTSALRAAAEVVALIGLGAVIGAIWILTLGGGSMELLGACAAIAASPLLVFRRPAPARPYRK